MGKKLEVAPLIYVQLDISWSELPSSGVFTEEELTQFHRAMLKLGFTQKHELEHQWEEVAISAGGSSIRPNSMRRYIFSNAEKDCQVEVTRSLLSIRQSRYTGFDDLVKLILSVSEALKGIEDIGNTGVSLFSIHYVDIIIPSSGLELHNYVDDHLIPYDPPVSNPVAKQRSTSSVSLLEKSDSKIRDIAVRFNMFKAAEKKFPVLIPVELQEKQDEVAMPLFLPHIEFKENTDYGILDIRHGCRLLKQQKFSDFQVESEIRTLYQTASNVFWDILSDHAKKEWGYECS